MILDRLENSKLYIPLHKNFGRAFSFLCETDLSQLGAGRHEIDGDRLFASVDRYDTQKREEGFFEAHRRYIDVQYVQSGRERIGLQAVAGMQVQEGYNYQKDIGVYAGNGDFILLGEGCFMILYPHEAHKPGCRANYAAERVHKIVVKVLCD